jgi:hypothetical protein
MFDNQSEMVGRGRALGDMASNRELIAEDEGQLAALWRRFEIAGDRHTAEGTARAAAMG